MLPAAALLVSVALLVGCDGDSNRGHEATDAKAEKAIMNETGFWALVEQSREAAGNDTEAQAAALERGLSELQPEDVLPFDRIFQRYSNAAYRWDLWAVAYIINGGCSDDCFDYFRWWLISRGQRAFDRALEEPETVGDLVESGDEIEAESFRYAPGVVYERVTGQQIPPDELPLPAEPAGEEWQEESVDKLYPRLAKQFGY
jgi:hypothetical protein